MTLCLTSSFVNIKGFFIVLFHFWSHKLCSSYLKNFIEKVRFSWGSLLLVFWLSILVLNELLFTLFYVKFKRICSKESTADIASQLNRVTNMFKLGSVWKFKFSHRLKSLVPNIPLTLFASFSVSPETHIIETSFATIAFQKRSLGIHLLSLVIVLLDIDASLLKWREKSRRIRKFSSVFFNLSLL